MDAARDDRQAYEEAADRLPERLQRAAWEREHGHESDEDRHDGELPRPPALGARAVEVRHHERDGALDGHVHRRRPAAAVGVHRALADVVDEREELDGRDPAAERGGRDRSEQEAARSAGGARERPGGGREQGVKAALRIAREQLEADDDGEQRDASGGRLLP